MATLLQTFGLNDLDARKKRALENRTQNTNTGRGLLRTIAEMPRNTVTSTPKISNTGTSGMGSSSLGRTSSLNTEPKQMFKVENAFSSGSEPKLKTVNNSFSVNNEPKLKTVDTNTKQLEDDFQSAALEFGRKNGEIDAWRNRSVVNRDTDDETKLAIRTGVTRNVLKDVLGNDYADTSNNERFGNENWNYGRLVDSYNQLDGDKQADVKQRIQENLANLKYSDGANKNDDYTMDTIQQLNDVYATLDKYGTHKGKSFGRQISDNFTTGGFVGDMAAPVENLLYEITGRGNEYKKEQEKRQAKRQDLGAVEAVNDIAGAIGNIGLNIGTGGNYGLANAGLNTVNTLTGLDDKVLDYDQNGRAYTREKTDKEKWGEVGATALNDIMAVGGKVPAINRFMPNLGNSGTEVAKLTAKDVAKYAATELPFAVGTTLAEEGFRNLANNREFTDYTPENFLKGLGQNLVQDVGMDIMNYGRGRKATVDNDRMKYQEALENTIRPNADIVDTDGLASVANRMNELDGNYRLNTKNTAGELKRRGINQLLGEIGDSADDIRTKLVNRNAEKRLTKALEQSMGEGVKGDVRFVRLDKALMNDINEVRAAQGLNPLTSRQVIAYRNAINNNLNNRVKEGMKPRDVAKIAYNALTSPQAEALPGTPKNTIVTAPYENRYDGAVLGDFDDTTSLKSIEPRRSKYVENKKNQKNDLLGRDNLGSPLTANQEGSVTQASSNDKYDTLEGSTSLGENTAPLRTRDSIVSQNNGKVNSDLGKQKQSKSVIYEKNQNYSDEANKVIGELDKNYAPVSNKNLELEAHKKIQQEGLANSYQKSMDNLKKGKKTTVEDKAFALQTLKELGTKTDDASLSRFHDLSQRLAQVSRDEAQKLQLNRILMKQSEAGMLKTGINSIEKAGGKVTPETTATMKKMIGEIKGYNPQIEKLQTKIDRAADVETVKRLGAELRGVREQQGYAVSRYSDYLGRQTPSENKLGSVYRASLLSGVKTQTKNAVSNALNFATEKATDYMAKPIDWAVSKVTGQTGIQPTMKGIGTGLKEGGKQGLYQLKTGLEVGDTSTAYEGKGRSELHFKNKALDKVVADPANMVFRVVSAGDKPVRISSELNALYQEAALVAKNKGLRGKEAELFIERTVANPSDAVLGRAMVRAEDTVFSSRNALADVVNSAQRKLRIKPDDSAAAKVGKKVGQTLLDTTIPFVKVPTNVAIKGFIDYNPTGAVKSVLQAGSAIKKGKFGVKEQGDFARGIAKSLIGTAAMGAGAALASNDMITGAYPTDARERAEWEAEGKTPNSIKIGDTYYQLGPLSLLFQPALMGANIQQNMERGADLLTATGSSYLKTAEALKDIPVLQGVQDLVELVAGDNYGNPGIIGIGEDPEGAANAIGNFVEDKILSLTVPNLVRSLATSTDPKVRQTEYGNFTENLMSRIPGLRQMLPAKSDVLGNELDNMTFISGFFDPLTVSQARQGGNAVVKELERLGKVMGDRDTSENGVKIGTLLAYPTQIKQSSGVKDENGETIRFSSEERAKAQMEIGKRVNQRYNEVMNSEAYKNASDQEKYDMLMKAKATVAQSAIKKAVINGEEVGEGGSYKQGDWYAVADGKIRRNDGEGARYTGDTSVLSGDTEALNMLAMTKTEYERDQEGDRWDVVKRGDEAMTKVLAAELEAMRKGHDEGTKSRADVEKAEEKLAKANERVKIDEVNRLATEAGESGYELEKLYGNISLTRWRELKSEDPELYQKLAEYDAKRAESEASGRSNDKKSRKYYEKATGTSRKSSGSGAKSVGLSQYIKALQSGGGKNANRTASMPSVGSGTRKFGGSIRKASLRAEAKASNKKGGA